MHGRYFFKSEILEKGNQISKAQYPKENIRESKLGSKKRNGTIRGTKSSKSGNKKLFYRIKRKGRRGLYLDWNVQSIWLG